MGNSLCNIFTPSYCKHNKKNNTWFKNKVFLRLLSYTIFVIYDSSNMWRILSALRPSHRSGILHDFQFPSSIVRKVSFSWSASSRSEEHTSELQSRQYLVCR